MGRNVSNIYIYIYIYIYVHSPQFCFVDKCFRKTKTFSMFVILAFSVINERQARSHLRSATAAGISSVPPTRTCVHVVSFDVSSDAVSLTAVPISVQRCRECHRSEHTRQIQAGPADYPRAVSWLLPPFPITCDLSSLRNGVGKQTTT